MRKLLLLTALLAAAALTFAWLGAVAAAQTGRAAAVASKKHRFPTVAVGDIDVSNFNPNYPEDPLAVVTIDLVGPRDKCLLSRKVQLFENGALVGERVTPGGADDDATVSFPFYSAPASGTKYKAVAPRAKLGRTVCLEGSTEVTAP